MAPSSSRSDSTSGGDAERDAEKVSESDESVQNEKFVKGPDNDFEEKGIYDVDDEGKRKRVKVILEHKTGKEMVQEVGHGQYSIPRW